VSHLSTLTLNRYRYGELDEGEVAVMRTHLDGCDHCSARLQGQENNRAAFELTPVPDFIKSLAPPAPKAAWWSRWQVWLAPALGATALVLIALPSGPSTAPDGLKDPERLPVETTQTKGAKDVLEAWLETDRGPRPLANGAEVGPGSRIQLRYRQTTSKWVTFAGADGSGEVEVYGTFPAEVGEQGWQAAPFALTLDDAAGIQKFYAVFTSTPPTPESVEMSLAAEGSVPGGETESIQLHKAR
jgi:hypothetical protein